VASRLLGAVELGILGLAALMLLAGAAIWVRAQRHGPRVIRTVRPRRTHVGTDARVDLELTARQDGATPQVTLVDEFDGGRRAARFLVPALERGQRARAAYRVPTGRRGRFTIGPATIGVSDPFGLARVHWAEGEGDQITVCPRVHDLRAPFGAPWRMRSPSPFVATFHAPAPEADELLGLREYEVGDDLRRIHWRATARTGELVVREDEAQWQPRATVLLDARERAHDAESFEAAVEAVASVVARLARGGDPYRVVTTSGHVLGEATAGQRHGVGIEARIMDELAVIRPEAHGPGSLARAVVDPARRGLLVAVVGTTAGNELDRLLAAGREGIPVVVVWTRSGPPITATRQVVVVDGRAGALVRSWDAAMLHRDRPRPTRTGA